MLHGPAEGMLNANSMSARCCRRIESCCDQRLMQRLEDVRFSQHRGGSVTVHIGSQILVGACKQHVDAALLQALAEFSECSGRRKIEVRDSAGVDRSEEQ